MRSEVLSNNGMKSWSLSADSTSVELEFLLTVKGDAQNAAEQSGGLHCRRDPRRKTKHVLVQTNLSQRDWEVIRFTLLVQSANLSLVQGL